MEGTARFVKTRRRYLMMASCLTLVVALMSIAASPQRVGPPRLLLVDLTCPSYPVSGQSPISLRADVLGTDDDEILKGITFKWNVTEASIVSGQGTRNIVLNPLVKTGVTKIKINVEAEGGPPQLHYEKSCDLTVNSDCSLPAMIDQYSSVSVDEEHKHLDQLAEKLKAGPPESIAYIMVYAGEKACIFESEWRTKRVRAYLTEIHHLSSARVVTVEAGFRKNWTVEIYVQPRPDCGPLPNPTLRAAQAHIQGRCGETR
ncbi:MAG TPA: hypothetical protein VLB68_10585 [Pyrinomonadaceae bacterium]|nr:hypothetical protein [Pyrinomonadaceae bacterium]